MFKLACAILSLVVFEVSGHGMLLDPPNRSSLWRYDNAYPANYNDNENFCGGIDVQWNVHGGKCGVCGDNFAAPHPQDNENTGLYGRGKIVATYTEGQLIETSVLLTANHLGHFEYSICKLENSYAAEPSEECFQKLQLADGIMKFPITASDIQVVNRIQLPAGLKCDHCVLRWHYSGANNWGQCDDGTSALGCGPQETFRSCSDIAIV